MVCHSKLAAVRYQKAIHAALLETITNMEAEETPNLQLIKKVKFLKAAVIISSDGTNEGAHITEARKQAKNWNAVSNFCKSFDFEDPEQEHTGIAFLVVCDMLLTGFDAPIEQVMYLDKKIREHTLLQAIARTNRVKKGKQRGYVVDYIGITTNLKDALKLYSGTDVQQELANSLKSIDSELPVLQERYQRLLNLFSEHKVQQIQDFTEGKLANMEADAKVVHAAVKLLKDERLRADFDVYLKKFLSSLDVILPHASGQPYRVPAKRLGYIQSVTKERYKDTTLNLGNAGQKVRDLINEYLISLGINSKVPPAELLSSDFIEKLDEHAEGNEEAKASEMEHAIRKHCTVHENEDPAFYKSLSEKVDSLIEKYKGQWAELSAELNKLRDIAVQGRQQDDDGMSKEASTFYDHITSEAFKDGMVPNEHQAQIKALMEKVVEILQDNIGSIDYWHNSDKQKRTRSEIKTALTLTGIFELKQNRERIAIEVMNLAKNRHDQLLKGL